MRIPNMDRIAEIAHTRAQDGAILGSQANFYGVQIEVQKGVMLGPWKLDVGDPKRANKGGHFGGEFQRLKLGRFKSLELPCLEGVPAT